jgi:RNA polymerase sigma factor (sigma-70 family)
LYQPDENQFERNWEQLKGIAAVVFHRMHVPVNDEDAWQIARIALWYAMQRYNPENCTKLGTYYYRVLQSHLSEYFASCHYGIQYPTSLMRASKRDRDRRLKPLEFISLDYRPDDSESEDTFADRIPSPTSLEEVERKIALEQMMERLKKYLTPRQYQVVSMVIGIFGYPPMEMADVANELGISTNRVNNVYWNAVNIIRRLVAKDSRLSVELLAILS